VRRDCPTDGCCATCDSVVMMAKACLPCDVSAATKRDCEMRESAKPNGGSKDNGATRDC
jgi:hypothetical protein